MASSPHPLERLLGPLRYASGRDFANLRTLKDLRGPLLAAVEGARGHLRPERTRALEAAAARIDVPDEAARRGAVLEVLAVLRDEGLRVDFVEAGRLPAAGAPALQAPPAPPTPPSPATPAAPPPRARAKAAAAPAARAPRKPKAPPAEEEATRVLSIAPRAGPLATPLKEAGWRLSPRLLGLLNRKGLRKVGDLLFLLPRVYEDRRQLKKIAQLRSGERGTAVVEVRRVDEVSGRGRRQFRAILGDSSGTLAATYFQGGPWLRARFPVGKKLVVSGEVRQSPWGWEMPHPEVEPADDVEASAVHFNRVVPVYPGFERHEQRSLRELTHRVCERYAAGIEEPLPDQLQVRLGLPGLGEALRALHFPGPEVPLEELNAHRSPAHRRLAFDELFFLQLGLALRREGVKVQPGVAFTVTPGRLGQALGLLPFTLTGAQRRAVDQVAGDMARPEPMNRLLQGDVGSGKTAVALVASALALLDGHQVAVMAPTELLAAQHFATFSRWLQPLGVRVGLLTGSGPKRERARERGGVAEGKIGVAVGTHALIQEGVEFRSLGLAVVDEQHRFGVMQRHALMSKGQRPDVLVMTATPIPRTLAMTLYGDLDVSVIDELPPGRTPIETRVFKEAARPRALELLGAQLAEGRQAYVVFPLVEESEKVDLSDATQGAAKLQAELPGFRVGLLHGRMKQEEKDRVMEAFRAHQLDVLVSTTVVEVGVDVPNASVMVVEHAERFGLSQLHQLRGRVGRGAARSWCLLMAGYALGDDSRSRLEVMEATTDGFTIAERDLELRGPGEFLGTRQSGLPELAVANLGRDQALMAQAQAEARAIVRADPRLEAPEHARLVRALEERWEGRLKLARVG